MKAISATNFLPKTEQASPRDAPLGLRLRVLFRRHVLDRELAEDHPAEAAKDCALRARQLTEPARCRQLAATLRNLVAHAESPSRAAFSSAIPVRRELVLIWREAFLDLAMCLERPAAVSPTGVARVLRLLTDGAGPLFNPYSDRLMSDMLCWVGDGFSELQPQYSLAQL